jgi:hypothetical protein
MFLPSWLVAQCVLLQQWVMTKQSLPFWGFLYTGPPLLRPLCHWIVVKVGRCGLLGQKGCFLSRAYRETGGESYCEVERLMDDMRWKKKEMHCVTCGCSHTYIHTTYVYQTLISESKRSLLYRNPDIQYLTTTH